MTTAIASVVPAARQSATATVRDRDLARGLRRGWRALRLSFLLLLILSWVLTPSKAAAWESDKEKGFTDPGWC